MARGGMDSPLTISRGAGQGSGAAGAAADVMGVAAGIGRIDVLAVASHFVGWQGMGLVLIVQDNNGHSSHQLVVGQVTCNKKGEIFISFKYNLIIYLNK